MLLDPEQEGNIDGYGNVNFSDWIYRTYQRWYMESQPNTTTIILE